MDDETVDLADLFDTNKPKKKDSPMDARATQKKAEEVFDEQEENETVEETETSEAEGSQVEEQEDSKPDENSVEFWKKKAEAAEKQKRDQQSYNDQRYNSLEKSFNEMKELLVNQQSQPRPEQKQELPEMSKEDLQDLIYEDPEKAMIYVAQKNGLINNQPQQPQINIQYAVQEQVARALNPDFDQAIEKFNEAIQLNPMILQEVQKSPNPVQAAYEKGKQILQAQKDPINREDLEAKIRAELEEEFKAKGLTRQSLRKVPASPGASGSKSVKQVTEIGDFFN